MLRIEVISGKNTGKCASFNDRVVRIGTAFDNDFQIDDDMADENHGYFAMRPGYDSYYYQDLRSMHGTRLHNQSADLVLLDHQECQKALLSQDVTVYIGRTVLRCICTQSEQVERGIEPIEIARILSRDVSCPQDGYEMQALLNCIHDISAANSLNKVYKALIDAISMHIDCVDRVTVWQSDRSYRMFLCSAEYVSSSHEGHMMMGVSQLRAAMLSGDSMLFSVHRVLPSGDSHSQVVVVPIMDGSTAEGVVIVETREAFTRDQFNWIVELARNASVTASRIFQNADLADVLDGFIRATISALDTRDPATAGHSMRVSNYVLMTAQAIHAQKFGPFADTKFTRDEFDEIQYAALLHDIGKVSIREEIVLKAGRMCPREYIGLLERIDLFGAWFETTTADHLGHAYRSPQHFARYREVVTRLQHADSLIRPEDREILTEMRNTFIPTRPNTPLLTASEQKNLLIPHGTLNEDERQAIQQHALVSWRYLSKILWPRRWSRVPSFVLQHHEKLNGSGYPYGIRGDAIFLQSRILTVCDIFDALTGGDRPYKQRHSFQEAAEILCQEVERGAIDKNVTALFIEQILPQLTDYDAYASRLNNSNIPFLA